MRIVILFGSEMGTAESAAEVIAGELAAHDVSLFDMGEFDVDDLDPGALHVMVCSTYGDGELPTNAEPFAAALDSAQPALDGLRFAVFGLGDSVYGPTFNRGGEIIAEKLSARGAVQLGEHARHDASTGVRVRELAAAWARDLRALPSFELATA
ncbi:flavodoxin domain-containing protein [Nocardia asteroides]|uniref:flavodoxin domain-containing protein n=1 Tax=Nocardia asteroides TaxID=1824 RepID=UPI001E46FF6F|nr:flavodoxin domain-containing protein [Nocardia asteroides]UGT64363.1 flavodoxin domain-containing protein [Nocardia asteroides]